MVPLPNSAYAPSSCVAVSPSTFDIVNSVSSKLKLNDKSLSFISSQDPSLFCHCKILVVPPLSGFHLSPLTGPVAPDKSETKVHPAPIDPCASS